MLRQPNGRFLYFTNVGDFTCLIRFYPIFNLIQGESGNSGNKSCFYTKNLQIMTYYCNNFCHDFNVKNLNLIFRRQVSILGEHQNRSPSRNLDGKISPPIPGVNLAHAGEEKPLHGCFQCWDIERVISQRDRLSIVRLPKPGFPDPVWIEIRIDPFKPGRNLSSSCSLVREKYSCSGSR